jgi:hypothetical protein
VANLTAVFAKHATLTAATVDVVMFQQGTPTEIEVYNRGSADIYFRTDGTAPTVAGDDCYVVSAGQSLVIDGAAAVQLISASATAYSVTRAE